jgi:hypothetical protein
VNREPVYFLGTGESVETPVVSRTVIPAKAGCNPIGFNEHGHDSAITFSRHPGAGRGT